MRISVLLSFFMLTACTAYVEVGAHHAVNLEEPTVGSFEAGIRYERESDYVQCQYTHLSSLMLGFPFNSANVPDLLNMYGCEYGKEWQFLE